MSIGIVELALLGLVAMIVLGAIIVVAVLLMSRNRRNQNDG